MDNDNALSGTANYTLTNLADGLHNITINCSDSTLSTIKTLNISIDHTLVDNSSPSISIIEPVNSSYLSSGSVSFRVSFNDSANVYCLARIDSNSWQDMANDAATSGIANYTFTNISDGSHAISVTAQTIMKTMQPQTLHSLLILFILL